MKGFLLFLFIITIFGCGHQQSQNIDSEANIASSKGLIEKGSVKDSNILELTKKETVSIVLPTKEEIEHTNSRLPALVAEGTMFTKVEFNEKTLVQTFYYDLTREVDESTITDNMIQQSKHRMVDAMRGTGSEDRLKAGVKYVYIYRSIDHKKLYDIKIDINDFK